MAHKTKASPEEKVMFVVRALLISELRASYSNLSLSPHDLIHELPKSAVAGFMDFAISNMSSSLY